MVSDRHRDGGCGARRVFVTGLGPFTALGAGTGDFASAFWEAYREGHALCGEKTSVPSRRIPEFDLDDFVETTRPYLDRHSKCALASGAMALSPREHPDEEAGGDRRGVTTGTVFGNMASMKTFQEMVYEKGARLASPVLFPHCYANTTNSLLSIEFGLRGYNQNFCGDFLAGAAAVESGFRAVRDGKVDLVLSGGGDVLPADLRRSVLGQASGNRRSPAEGMCLFGLGNEDVYPASNREAGCELCTVVSEGTGLVAPPEDESMVAQLAGRIRDTIDRAVEQAGMWEGDIGAVLTCPPPEPETGVEQAADEVLERFGELPVIPPLRATGHTFAAAFPLQCVAGLLVLLRGTLPSVPELTDVREGVEMWFEQEEPELLGEAALVVGYSYREVTVAILKGI
ncbi:MAG: beta-ketoacyl synthase N-terminal-like domain-containing protein [Candidatus Brocadiia bacterium]